MSKIKRRRKKKSSSRINKMENRDDNYSIMNYNVNYVFAKGGVEDANAVKIMEAIGSISADIVCLQETHKGYESLIVSKFGENYPHRHFYHSGAAGGIATLSKYPIEKTLVLDNDVHIKGRFAFFFFKFNCKSHIYGASSSWFKILVCVLNVDGERVQVVNVHLRPPVEDSGKAYLWTMRTTSSIRKMEVEYMLKRLPENPSEVATFIVGDFNENDGYSALEELKKGGFADALQEYCPKVHTHWWILFKFYKLLSRLDHSFYNKTIKALSCEVVEGYEGNASDHLPIVTTFVFERK